MPALTAIISADADPFRREMDAVEQMAKRSGVKVVSNLSGGGEGHGIGINKRMIYELKHAFHELSEGNLGAALMPVMGLAQHLGILKYAYTNTAHAAIKLAAADREVATAAGVAAIASTKKAQAAMAALYAVGGETAANLTAAISAEEKAAADILSMKASTAKAEASEAAAAAAMSEATTVMTAAGFIVAAVAIIVGAYYLWEYRVKKLAEAISEIETPELVRKDIGALSAYEIGWRKITEAIHDATFALQGANEAFAVNSKHLAENQRHEKSMLDSKKRLALEQAGRSPIRRLEVMEKYASLESAMERRQAEQRHAAAQQHIQDLEDQAKASEKAANSMKGVITETGDDLMKRQYEQDMKFYYEKDRKTGKNRVEEADARATELREKRADLERRGYGPNGLPDENQLELEAKERTLEQAQKARDGLEAWEKGKKNRDEQRRAQRLLYEDAAKSSADAVRAQKALGNQKQLDAQAQRDRDAERLASLDIEGSRRSKMLTGTLTQYQRQGAFTSGSSVIVDLNKRMAHHLESIDRKVGAPGAFQPPRLGGARF